MFIDIIVELNFTCQIFLSNTYLLIYGFYLPFVIFMYLVV